MALRNALTLAAALAWMVVVSPDFTGLVLLLDPPGAHAAVPAGAMQRLSVRAQDRFAEAVGYAGEGLEALETVQAFGRGSACRGGSTAAVESAFARSRAQISARGLMSGLMIA